MRDLNIIMDEIDSKKEMIAKAISLAFCDGDMFKAKAMYPSIVQSIRNTYVGVIKTNEHDKSNYDREIEELLDDIDSYIRIDAKKTYFEPPVHFAFNPLESRSVKEFDENMQKKLEKAYLGGIKVFLKVGVSFEDFVMLYKLYGEKALKAAKTAKILQRKLIFSSWKRAYSLEKERFEVREFISQFGDVINEYSVQSLDDLMTLYTEISSVLMDGSSLGEEEKKIIEENRMKLYKRTGNVLINQDDLLYLKKRIEDLYANYSMGKCLKESNMNELISRFGLTLDKEIFRHFTSFYGYVHTVDGFNVNSKIHGKLINFTFLNDKVFERYNKSQDLMIIHELIHSVESHTDGVRPFNNECKYFNEALTEYFAREAYKYMEPNIVSEVIKKGSSEYSSVYDCMLPLVELLKDSSIWTDVVYCKLTNDYSLLNERIGGYATKISKIFDNVYKKSRKGELDHKTFVMYKIDMIKLNKEIQDNFPRYNKKTVI